MLHTDDLEEPAPRPTGGALLARIVAAALAALVPISLTMTQVTAQGLDFKGWNDYRRVDVVVLVFAVLMIVTLAASYASGSPALPLAAVALAFAMFGLVLAFPMEQLAATQSNLEIGGILAILSSLGSGLAALVAAASDAASSRLR